MIVKKYSSLQKYTSNKRKGYIIEKKNIPLETLISIKDELTLQPKVHKDYCQNIPDVPVYFESKKRIIVPPYWAREHIGKASKNFVQNGEPFTQELKTIFPPRDYQEPIVDKTLKQLKKIKGAFITIGCGGGKCWEKDTEILMYDGTIKKVQDIKVGDKLMGDDSTERNVLSLARGRETMYKIIPKRGKPYTVNESHILSLKCSTKCRFGEKGDIFDISLKEYLKLPKMYHGRGSPICGYKVPVNFPEKQVSIDPYIIGFWLGDGSSHTSMISNQEAVVLKYIKEKVKEYDCYLQYHSQYDYRITSYKKYKKGNQFIKCKNYFLEQLKKLKLINNKHIPLVYKCNSREKRLKLLAGLLDSDGYKPKDKNYYCITQKNEKLLDDIVYLSLSLGFYAEKKEIWKSCINGNKEKKKYFTTQITGFGIEEIPVLCPRKKCVARKQISNPLNSLITVEKLGEDNYYGFMIDGNHRLLLSDFTVNHNTFLAIYLATLLKQKTLIIVHTSVLLDQWIERINYFVPDAKIGKIKGKTFDIEGKDFVIAMLQTVIRTERGYNTKTFEKFGVTIVDEAHHIAAPSFSKALPIISTKYKIGLSATPERNDKLENIFYWWIGPSAWYDRKREGVYTLVKFVRYYEESFVEKKRWNGGFDLVKMIENIITNNRRNKFIIKQAKHYAKMGRQVIILSTRRSHLEDLKSRFDKKMLIKDNGKQATTGLYVGGMKSTQEKGLEGLKPKQIDEIIESQIDKVPDEYKKLVYYKNGGRRMKDGKVKIAGTKKQKIELIENSDIEYTIEKKASLEESAKSDVLFATYQLVSEGTDIPTLNTLIMASPKKEVEQVVGRIQRAKTDHKPLVLDICDMFSVYQNQGRHRQRFYKKQDYVIDELEYDAQETKEIPIIEDQEMKKCNNILDKIKKRQKKKESEVNIDNLNEYMLCLSD